MNRLRFKDRADLRFLIVVILMVLGVVLFVACRDDVESEGTKLESFVQSLYGGGSEEYVEEQFKELATKEAYLKFKNDYEVKDKAAGRLASVRAVRCYNRQDVILVAVDVVNERVKKKQLRLLSLEMNDEGLIEGYKEFVGELRDI